MIDLHEEEGAGLDTPAPASPPVVAVESVLPEDGLPGPSDALCTVPPAASAGSAPGATAQRRASQAARLVQLAHEAGIELFQCEHAAYATFPVNDHREGSRLRGGSFKRWLGNRFFNAEGGAIPGSQAFADAISTLEGHALFGGPQLPLSTRVGEHEGRLYLDLANERWEAVRIDENGWEVVSDPPVKFRRPKGMLPLPYPVQGGSVDELRPFINIGSDQDWRLVMGWLLAAFRPCGPYPVLVLHGEQGSAKSTTTRALRALIDPNQAPLRAASHSLRDLMIATRNNWVITLENVSHIPPQQSDALCFLATGGGFATRAIFTDEEEAIFSAARPILMNGIGEFVTRSDLLDRALLISLPNIGAKRRSEEEFWAAFQRTQPRVLGALLDAVSAAMKRLPTVQLDHLPRMADFARWGTAAEMGLGWPAGSFMTSYQRSRDEANSIALMSSPVAQAVLQLMTGAAEWSGTASELQRRLEAIGGGEVMRRRDWPRSPQALSTTLRRVAPNLRHEGVSVDFQRQAHTGQRLIYLSRRIMPGPDWPPISF